MRCHSCGHEFGEGEQYPCPICEVPALVARKRPSGAQNRKRKKEAQELLRRAEAERRAPDDVPREPRPHSIAPVAAPHLQAYADLGPPPLDDPTTALVWAQRAGLIALHEILMDPFIDSMTRWKLISDYLMKLGTTHAKTAMEAKIAKVAAKLLLSKDVSGGPKAIPSGITRPETARRGSSSGRSDTDPRPVSDSPTSEDAGDDPMGGGEVGPGKPDIH